ncbi:hypothetical protein RN001_005040 [Aquatica leii]|uniref:Uncharacterized protein n=1 Tax=Aquatica leii TaxID=1421715 RepID=A0AAN7PJ96_9COLE|nr:hypothetical protein RN001_005040 [Aquatica leii]
MKRDKDPDRREVMKKFTFKGVLDNFRTSVVQPTKPDQEIQESLRPENFQLKRIDVKWYIMTGFLLGVNKSDRSGAGEYVIYKPSLLYFDFLQFLNDQETPRQSRNTMAENEESAVDAALEQVEEDVHECAADAGPSKASCSSNRTLYRYTSRSHSSTRKRKEVPNDNGTTDVMKLVGKTLESLQAEDAFQKRQKMSKRQKKTTRFQYEELIVFVGSNKVLLHGKTKPLEANIIKNLWQTFATKMTLLSGGAMKSADQWKKIFVEWKVNVKRKSRSIKEEITGTGGGPKINKPLSDLEERLLNLISKAHLGDASLPDTLGHEEAEDGLGEIEEPEVIDLANFIKPLEVVSYKENGDEVKRLPSDQSSDNAILTSIPSVVEKPPSKTLQREKISRSGRSTNLILQEACSSFKNANDANMKSSEMLAEAFNNFTNVFKIKAEADMLRAKAEMAKAKCLHFQTFGNLDDF